MSSLSDAARKGDWLLDGLSDIINPKTYAVRAAKVCIESIGMQESLEELSRCHRLLHEVCADKVDFDVDTEDDKLILGAELAISQKLRGQRIEHRYDDPLSHAAGTYIGKESQHPLTADEILSYLHAQPIDLFPIELGIVQGSKEDVVCRISSPLLASGADRLLDHVQSLLPPTVKLHRTTDGVPRGLVGNEIVALSSPYTLELQKKAFDSTCARRVTTVDKAFGGLRAIAAQASRVFKSSTDLNYLIINKGLSPFDLVAAPPLEQSGMTPDAYERIVTGVLLEPEVPDGTKTVDERTREVIADADIYSEEEIRKAMYWWMEHANHLFTYFHRRAGGRPLGQDQVRLLENWQTRVDQEIGGQFVRKGTWLATARILDDALWRDILDGTILSWSVGMLTLGEIVDAPEGLD